MADTVRDSTSPPSNSELETKLGTGHGEQEEKKPKKIVPLYKLFSYADCIDKILMMIGTIGAIVNGVSRPFMAVLLGEIIDNFGKQQRHDASSHRSEVPLRFVYLALGSGVGAFLQVACWMITGERQGMKVRNLYLKTLLRQEIAYFDKKVNSGEVNGTMTSDTFLFQDAIGEKVGKLIQVVAGVIGGFAIAFVEGWLLALVLFSSYPLIFMLGKIMKIFRQKILLRSKIARDNATNLVQETIGSIRTVASFTGEKQAMASYKTFLTNSYKFDMCTTLNIGVENGLHSFLSFNSISLGVWFGGILILHKDYSAGKVFTVFLAVVLGSGFNFLQLAYSSLAAFTVAQVAAYKMFEVINRKPIIDAFDTKGKVLDNISGDIELRNVCFSYPSRSKDLVLNGLSLFIPNGTTTALVGHSGSGKSTIISLIERFYDPQSGKILIDGIDLREFQVKWIRSKIGLVSQEPVLFTSTIKDNIGHGKDGATLEEIRAAAQFAKADDFINELPQGLDTRVGEHGIQLSGGQKQRIAIARAILKNPRILLLDEATSALDTNSERDVQDSLDKLMVNRTTIIVAHRLSTIKNANMIAVIQKGRIVEKGSPLELLKDLEGNYSTLISSEEVDEVSEQTFKHDSYIATEFNRKSDQMISSNHNLKFNSCKMKSSTSWSESLLNVNATKTKKVEKPQDIEEVSIFRLAHLNKPEFPVLIVATMFAVVMGAYPQVYAFIISNVIEAFYQLRHKLKRDSQFWALMIFILSLVSLISNPSKTYLFGVAGNRLIQRIRLKCFEKVINMEIGWFDEPQNSSAIIGARLSKDATKIRILVGDALANYVQLASSLTVGLTVAFGASWQLSLIVLALIPLIGFNMYVQMKSIKGFGDSAKVKYEEASQVSSDAIGNIRTVASFCAEERIMKMHNQKCQAPMANVTKKGLIGGTGFGISACFLYLAYAVIFYAGEKLVQDGKIRPSHVFRVYYALSMVSLAIYATSSLATDTNEAKIAVASIISILRRESKIDPSNESGMTLENIDGEIELSHVNFSYPSRPSDLILRALSLTIHCGQVVALVGESGSGKSTVISLLQRFYNPNSGRITLDGIEIQKFQLKWLRQQIGVVSQEPILFNATIRANIASGKGGSATEAEIISAARLANAHDFISSLQEGYDTIVGERGIQLSGGQKQRVAIARAIVKDPKILLLDEATSALDVESEKLVQETLDKVMLNKTTVVVAHRLSTIQEADVIAVFKNGCIVEKGNHNTLIDLKHGFYSSLVGLQMTSS